MMITLEGKSVFGGVAIGKIQFYKRNEITIKRTRVEDVEAEVERFQNAKAKTLELLKGLYEKALEDVGEANYSHPGCECRICNRCDSGQLCSNF